VSKIVYTEVVQDEGNTGDYNVAVCRLSRKNARVVADSNDYENENQPKGTAARVASLLKRHVPIFTVETHGVVGENYIFSVHTSQSAATARAKQEAREGRAARKRDNEIASD
jgi:hypothetical protein